jgi:hypothetical protein
LIIFPIFIGSHVFLPEIVKSLEENITTSFEEFTPSSCPKNKNKNEFTFWSCLLRHCINRKNLMFAKFPPVLPADVPLVLVLIRCVMWNSITQANNVLCPPKCYFSRENNFQKTALPNILFKATNN